MSSLPITDFLSPAVTFTLKLPAFNSLYQKSIMPDQMLSWNQQSMHILSSGEHGFIYPLNDLQRDFWLGNQFKICGECSETERF